jgi:hypothetical protein
VRVNGVYDCAKQQRDRADSNQDVFHDDSPLDIWVWVVTRPSGKPQLANPDAASAGVVKDTARWSPAVKRRNHCGESLWLSEALSDALRDVSCLLVIDAVIDERVERERVGIVIDFFWVLPRQITLDVTLRDFLEALVFCDETIPL